MKIDITVPQLLLSTDKDLSLPKITTHIKHCKSPMIYLLQQQAMQGTTQSWAGQITKGNQITQTIATKTTG